MTTPDAEAVAALRHLGLPPDALAFLHAAGWTLTRRSEREALVAALKTLVEDTPCRFDHHGGCQEHGFLEPDDPWSPCPMAEAQRLVGMSEQKPVYDRRPSRAAIEAPGASEEE